MKPRAAAKELRRGRGATNRGDNMVDYLKGLVAFDFYKAAQGQTARKCTMAGIAIVFLLGAVAFHSSYNNIYGAIAIAVLGFWIAFRTVHFPVFADFLISVEGEMAKVTWPTKRELFANTKVVLLFMALFTVLIFAYDLIFRLLFNLLP